MFTRLCKSLAEGRLFLYHDKTPEPHRSPGVVITLHQQTKNQISVRCQIDNLSNLHKKGNLLNVLLYVFNKLPKKCCRRGSRTAHDEVSQDTKTGGQPQSAEAGITSRLSLIHHPRDRRAWLPISSPYNIKKNNPKI